MKFSMKYLKRFNEELKPQTYLSAARKLDKMGHGGRAKELKDWAGEVEKKEEIEKWKKNIENFSKYGVFKIKVENPESDASFVGDFHLDITFDELSFEDSFEYERSQVVEGGVITGVWFPFFIGIIPANEDVLGQCEMIMPEPEFNNGFYWAMTLSLNFEVKGKQITITGWQLEDYDYGLSGNISFADRGSAVKFKNLLSQIFNDPNFDYPSGYTNANTMYEVLQRSILQEGGFSDYTIMESGEEVGFELEHLGKYVKSITPNALYQS